MFWLEKVNNKFMKRKPSTGALTKEQVQAQNKCYAQNHKYDYVIIGTGNSALVAGALLAHAGKKVCLLEAHDRPGGYLHTFRFGDFHFCAQVHYVWGCYPGGKINVFLKKIGLNKDILWKRYDPKGYDHMIMPDGKRVKIPYGWNKLAENIDRAYPGQKAKVRKFTNILEEINDEVSRLPDYTIKKWKLINEIWRFPKIVRYLHATLQQVFDQCHLSKQAQAVLVANAGDLMAPPNELSIFAYSALFGGYNTGAYYPAKHYRYYVDRLEKFITDHEGCHFYYQSKVIKINTQRRRVASVVTEEGKTFTADTFICNMDPQAAAKMIGLKKVPKRYLAPLQYEYSPSGMMVYLGLKNIDLKKYGFGNHNTWHLLQWDMNKMWQEQLKGNFSAPWIFISTPTLHSKQPGVAPKGGEIMEIGTLTDYDSFKKFFMRDVKEYKKLKNKIAERLIDIVEKYHVPDLRKHIVVKVVGSTKTSEDFVQATRGNAYGSKMTPKQMGLGRLKSKTPWKNFFWCNASSGYAGIYGTTHTGMSLYSELTHDRF